MVSLKDGRPVTGYYALLTATTATQSAYDNSADISGRPNTHRTVAGSRSSTTPVAGAGSM